MTACTAPSSGQRPPARPAGVPAAAARVAHRRAADRARVRLHRKAAGVRQQRPAGCHAGGRRPHVRQSLRGPARAGARSSSPTTTTAGPPRATSSRPAGGRRNRRLARGRHRVGSSRARFPDMQAIAGEVWRPRRAPRRGGRGHQPVRHDRAASIAISSPCRAAGRRRCTSPRTGATGRAGTRRGRCSSRTRCQQACGWPARPTAT